MPPLSHIHKFTETQPKVQLQTVGASATRLNLTTPNLSPILFPQQGQFDTVRRSKKGVVDYSSHIKGETSLAENYATIPSKPAKH